MRKQTFAVLIALGVIVSGISACSTKGQNEATEVSQPETNPNTNTDAGKAGDQSSGDQSAQTGNESGTAAGEQAEQVVANATSDQVLVNKLYRLPEGYVPTDLVYPDIPFTFKEKIEKRKLRKEAADAVEKMVSGAKADGIYLAGVSGYRSEDRQRTLFDSYVRKDGLEAANRYSAKPGYSEHQTGLAIDMTSSDGKCAAEDCFGGTKEAKWLSDHSYEYGFIVRYLQGKEGITGYKYEPWHLRYVGTEVAKAIYDQGVTLEEYYNGAVPVIGGITKP